MKWDARLYDEQNGPREEAGKRLIAMAGICPDDRVLDIGCGTGTLTAELARLASAGRVVGLDPSEDMLVIAKAKTATHDNVTLLRGRAEEIEFSGEFSLAYSSNALQWVIDQKSAVQRIYSALEPGGRLAAQMPASGFSSALLDCIRQGLEDIGRSEEFHLPWYLPEREEYQALLEKTGFTGVEVRNEDISMVFRSSSDALEWALSAALVPFMARLDRKAGEYFKYAVEMNFERYRVREEIVCDFRRIIAYGHRPH